MLHRYVPAHFRSPVRLAARLVRTGDPAAWFAMAATAGGVAAAPLDLALAPLEHRRYAAAHGAPRPLLLVCGAPRSGTTVVHQTLAAALPVDHFTNVVNLFPRSPLIATQLLKRRASGPPREFHSFYGRTAGLAGLSDALPIWERYLGANGADAPPPLDDARRAGLRRFFSAWTQAFARPLISKCNRLIASAADVAAALPEATIACVERHPLWHAQSLYQARQHIHGDLQQPYGLAPADSSPADDPVDSVCEQVLLHRRLADQHAAALGLGQFWRVSYEEFCREPAVLVKRAHERLFADSAAAAPPNCVNPHKVRCAPRLDAAVLQRIRSRLVAMNLLTDNDVAVASNDSVERLDAPPCPAPSECPTN